MEFYDLPKNKMFMVSLKALIELNCKLLLLKCSDRDAWGLPGGLLEYDEDLENCLKREVTEETSLKVRITNIFCTGAVYYPKFVFRDKRVRDIRIIQIAYWCDLTNKEKEIALSEEHREYKWVTKNDLKKIRCTSDSEGILKKYFHEMNL